MNFVSYPEINCNNNNFLIISGFFEIPVSLESVYTVPNQILQTKNFSFEIYLVKHVKYYDLFYSYPLKRKL